MESYIALILAAGKGTRMKSELCKVMHPVAGRPMISYVVEAALGCGLDRIAVIVGHQGDTVRKFFEGSSVEFIVQEPQLGTGHAVLAGREVLEPFPGHILVLCGDIPLMRSDTLREFINQHDETGSTLSVMTTLTSNPRGYGRIVRDSKGQVTAIVEEKDASEAQRAINEINTGIYLLKADTAFGLLDQISSNNAQNEYYLTDIIAAAVKRNIPVSGFVLDDGGEALGINTRMELAQASAVIWDRKRRELMDSGVTLLDPNTIYIDSQVEIDIDTVIHPSVTISGKTRIGSNCRIESGVYIIDSVLDEGVQVLQGSRLNGAQVGAAASIGPMAHIRPETLIGKKVRVGNFVEIKKSSLGEGTKASHLTYLGDSAIGKEVNIGCGTITCNYDGKAKHPTIIEDHCFVGSDVQFVAPVKIGEGSLIGAGSTITRDVPPKTLAVTRAKQKNYPLRRGQGPE
jgi:bifunctional UDP-N-acetylglucosamine pyrophosphorylase / glucosamine-1-phosphate N-acetyltransferase